MANPATIFEISEWNEHRGTIMVENFFNRILEKILPPRMLVGIIQKHRRSSHPEIHHTKFCADERARLSKTRVLSLCEKIQKDRVREFREFRGEQKRLSAKFEVVPKITPKRKCGAR